MWTHTSIITFIRTCVAVSVIIVVCDCFLFESSGEVCVSPVGVSVFSIM